MTDLFTTPPAPAKPARIVEQHYCLICERVGGFGVKLTRLPKATWREALPGDGFHDCAWYCAEHIHIGRDLLKRERGGA